MNVSGPGTLASGATSETVYVSSNTVPVVISSEAGQPGTIVVTATGSGLTSASMSVPTYVNTAPASLQIQSTQGTDSNGNPYTLYTVTLLDSNGHAITNESGNLTVTDNHLATGGTIVYGTVSNGVFTPGTAPTTFTNGIQTFAVESGTDGTSPVTITVDDTTNALTATTTYNYVAGAPTTVTVSPAFNSGVYDVEGGQTVTYQAQLVDGSSNNVAEAGQSVIFQFVPTTGNTASATLPNGLASGTYTAVTNSQGVASVTVTVPAGTTSGNVQLEATYNGNTVEGDQATVVGAVAYSSQVTVTGTPTTAILAGTANALSGVMAYTENAVGTNLAGDTLQITSSNPNVIAVASGANAPNSETLTAGASGTALTGLNAELAGSSTITVQDISNPSMPKTSFTVDVVPGQATTTPYVEYNGAQVSTTNTLAVTANQAVAVQVVNVDAGGNPVPVAGSTPLTVDLFDANGGSYRLSPSGANISSVQIPAGQTSVTVYYINGTTETLTGGLTAADGGTVTAAKSAATLSSAASITAGTSVTVSGTIADQNGVGLSGEAVSVAFDGQTATTTSGANGAFSVSLTPTKVSASSAAQVTVGGTTFATSNSTAVTAAATLTGATYSAANHTLTLTFSGKVTASTVTAADLAFTAGTTGDTLGTVSYGSGSGTTTLVLDLSGETIGANDTVNLAAAQTAITDAYGNAAAPDATAPTI